ncbi:MAG: hypothetical protein ACJ8EL_15490 [Rhizomicrobium sp.]
MKMLILTALAAPLLVASSLAAAPGVSDGGAAAAGKASISATAVFPDVTYPRARQKRTAILAVRKEGLQLQAADGGKLTEAHRAYLQTKFDAVLVGNY